LPARKIAVHNLSDGPIVIDRISCDPVQDAGSGLAVDARPSATWDAPNGPLQPGERAIVEVFGEAPGKAGSYTSNLRIRATTGEALIIPISLQVGASPIRGIAAMVGGLVALGIVNFVAGEAAVKTKLHEVLELRQDADEWLEQPDNLSSDLDALDRDTRRAVQHLTAPPNWSVVDHRIEEAEERERAAKVDFKEIRDAITRAPAGAAEVAELDQEWRGLQRRLAELRARREAIEGQTVDDLAGRVAALLTSFKQSLVDLPMSVDAATLAAQIARVDLMSSAGQRDEANRRAIDVRRWLQRDARDLEKRLALLEQVEVLAGSLVGEDARVRQGLSDPALSGETRQNLTALVDRATARLSANASLSDLADAHAQILAVATQLLKARSDAMVAAVAAALQKEERATSLAAVEAAMADNPPAKGSPPAARIAFLRRVLAAWNGPLSQADQSTQRNLKARIAAIEGVLDRGDLKASAPLYRGLIEAWSDYQLARLRAAVFAVSADYCRSAGAGLRRGLAVTEQTMQLLPDQSDLPGWERTADRIRLRVDAIPIEACMVYDLHREKGSFAVHDGAASPFFGLSAEAVDLSQKVFAASLARVSIRLGICFERRRSRACRRPKKFAGELLHHHRSLTIEAITPIAERYAGRRIPFRVGGLDPGWGAGVQVAVDYGDRSAIASMSAEEAGKRFFVHSYEVPTAAHLQVAAAFGFAPGTLDPTDTLLGRGGLNLAIGRSPVTAARVLLGHLF
jgi:hypothetical protein